MLVISATCVGLSPHLCVLKQLRRVINTKVSRDLIHGPDLQNIFCNNLTIVPKLRSTYDERLIYKTSYEEREAFLRYDLHALS